MAANPIQDEEIYTAIYLAGTLSPGVVTLSGHDRVIGWDVKKAAGTKGATLTRTSEDPVEFTCSFYLTDEADFEAWPAFATLLNSTIVGATPKALDIYHPDLASNGIFSVVLKSFGGVVHDGQGGQTIAVKLLEYRPPAKATGSPSGSKSAPKKKNAAPDPNADRKAELARLTQQYRDTPWG